MIPAVSTNTAATPVLARIMLLLTYFMDDLAYQSVARDHAQ
jgi:hypothetical protein